MCSKTAPILKHSVSISMATMYWLAGLLTKVAAPDGFDPDLDPTCILPNKIL